MSDEKTVAVEMTAQEIDMLNMALEVFLDCRLSQSESDGANALLDRLYAIRETLP